MLLINSFFTSIQKHVVKKYLNFIIKLIKTENFRLVDGNDFTSF